MRYGALIWLLAMLQIVSGCMLTKDVTNQAELSGGYLKGTSYVLVIDVAVTEFGLLSAASARINNCRTNSKINEGIVASGTVMTLEKVQYRQHPEDGISLHPLAVIKTGPWTGRLVDLVYLSRGIRTTTNDARQLTILEPNPTYLEKVEKGAQEQKGSPIRGSGQTQKVPLSRF